MFIIDFIHGLAGGTENQLVKLINNLPTHKYDLYLVSLRTTQWLKKNASQLKCTTQTFNVIKLKNPLSIISFISVFRYIKIKSPDVVVTFFPLSNIAGVFIAKLAGVKLILSTRRDYGLWLNQWSIPLLKIANNWVTRIVVNSHKVKELICRKEYCDSSKIDVIYNGIELNDFKEKEIDGESRKDLLGIPPQSKVVGIVGGLKPMKRHRTFLQAAQVVLHTQPDTHFVIVGDGHLRSELENFSSELGIAEKVHFAGSQKDVRPYLSLLDIGVNCSANEGFSNAIMEYMAYGVPCIVSSAGGNPELIDDHVNGYTFGLDNHAELAQCIIRLLDDTITRRQFIAASQNRIQDLSVHKMIAQYDNYFTELVHNARKP